MNHQQVLDLFVDQNVLQKTQADDVLTEAQQNGKTIVQAMVDGGFMDESGFYRTVAEGIGAQFIDLNDHEIPPAVVKLVPAGLARLHRALPVDLVDNTLRVALADPLESRTEEDLRFALGRDIEVVVAPVEQIEDRIRIFYGSDTSSMDEVLKQLGEVGELMQLREGDGAGGAEAEANATPIIRFVDLILYQAIQDRASDIHFEPFENEFKIRYRRRCALRNGPAAATSRSARNFAVNEAMTANTSKIAMPLAQPLLQSQRHLPGPVEPILGLTMTQVGECLVLHCTVTAPNLGTAEICPSFTKLLSYTKAWNFIISVSCSENHDAYCGCRGL